jgi:hypothetical protein
MRQHLSIRVPWHDNGWDGTVCRNPERNQACRVLKAIAEDKNDTLETEYANQPFCIKNNYLPPCLAEGGMFMSENAVVTLPIEHPYTYAPRYNHIAPTPYRIDAFSLISKPFFWTLREEATKVAEDKIYNTGYDDSIELDVGSGSWVSNGINQKHIFDYFYRNVTPGISIAVVYAKAVPFIEIPGRVIIGIGMITSVEDTREYSYNRKLEPGDISSYLWERQIGHSIRDTRENGFIFPFYEIQKYLIDHPEQSPEELVVIAPDGYFKEFSYATEHLSHDALILMLNQTITVLQKYKQIGLPCGHGENWDYCIDWCKEKLKAVWRERGLYPGLGNVLQASGIPYGHDISTAIREKISDDKLWEELPALLATLKDYIQANLNSIKISKTELYVWKKMTYDMKLPFLKLLSRINLTLDQAKVALEPTKVLENANGKPHYADFLSDIKKIKIADILANPYILYEKTRLFEEKFRFGIGQIDVAMFPDPIIGGDIIVDEADDVRRLRAIVVSILENAAQSGSTLMITDDIVRQVNVFRSDVDLQVDVSALTFQALKDAFSVEFSKIDLDKDVKGEKITALQLNRFIKIDDVIRAFMQSRIGGDIEIKGEWNKYLKEALKRQANTEHEPESRSEKLKAIEIMAKSRISALTGGAGTGKTTTLAALCLCPEIQQNGITILAPTGKARVVLDKTLRDCGVTCQEAYTVFQFLQKTSHCDWKTYRYYLSGKNSMNVAGRTVIIDECSMLTEEMLGALAETLHPARRVIIVGDPNQLPPIGAGRPFYELVEYLREKHSSHFAKLTVSNRQNSKAKERLDVELAKLFTYDQSKEVGDDIFSRVAKDNENVEFVTFTGDSDIHETVLKTLAKAVGMHSIDDIKGFDESLGGEVKSEWMNFTDVSRVEGWQILSPYRNDTVTGSATINRYIHERYRINTVSGNFPKKRSTQNPLGSDGIIYGEKVINIRNQSIYGYPSGGCLNYVANGEVGIVERIWQKPKDKRNTHQVRFTSQKDHCYNWDSKITDSDSDLELAYALTVHKAQGSGFGTTIFIINEPPKGLNVFISREMIYTALSRQKDKIFIVYNKPVSELKKYADSFCSDLARRLTSLFESPIVRKFNEHYYASNLIHITRSGVKVRSKSEVIIANELDNTGIAFEYEKKLVLNDGKEFIPDFTVFMDSVDQIYWEHLGMLSNGDYRKKWEYKKSEYTKNGISEEHGNLIVTEDNANGGIDSSIIAQHVKSLFGRPQKEE